MKLPPLQFLFLRIAFRLGSNKRPFNRGLSAREIFNRQALNRGFRRRKIRCRRGQIILEYILLLLISVSLALVLTKGFVNVKGGDTVLVNFWTNIIKAVAEDVSS